MGPIQGFLFLAVCILMAITHVHEKWPVRRTALAFLEAVPPFVGVLLGKRLLDVVRARESSVTAPA